MKKSLRVELICYLSVAILLIISLMSYISYQSVADELGELYDANLEKMASSMADQHRAEYVGKSVTQTKATKVKVYGEEDYLLTIINQQHERLYSSHQAAFNPDLTQLGISTQRVNDKQWRVFILKKASTTFIAAQDLKLRSKTVKEVAINQIMPQLLIVPFLIMISLLIVRKTFKPMMTISENLQNRTSDYLKPFDLNNTHDEVKPIIEALNQWMAKVAALINQQKRFTADAAHELRTPITAIKLQLEAMNNSNDINEIKEILTLSDSSIKRTERLVNQLLTLAKVEPNNLFTPTEKLNLKDSILNVINELSSLYSAKNIDLGFEQADEATIQGVPDEIEILIKNLILNAIQHTPNNGLINISTIKVNDVVTINIEDSGAGIAPNEMERVFDRFYRLENHTVIGSGLGLAIVKEIANKHHVKVLLKNNTAKTGLTVSVTLKAL